MPAAAIRRPLTVTTWVIVSVLCLLLSPGLLAVAAIVRALTGRAKPLILTRLAIAYFRYELGALCACAVLWLASGAGILVRTRPFQLLHWRLLRWFVHGLARRARKVLKIDVTSEDSSEAARALEEDRPVIVFSRHAGPGDTFLITDQLAAEFDRRPSVVFKETLAIDPGVDLLAHRLPHAVLDTSDREECERRIQTVTAELGPRGALLLFPEGGNFTRERRSSALRKLRRKGRRQSAARAERMRHVMPPQPTGALAALRANPSADVIFAAHTGLGLAAYAREIVRNLPVGRTLRHRMWLVPASEVPPDPDDQISWLYDWWSRIDRWLEQQQSEVQSRGSPQLPVSGGSTGSPAARHA